MKLIPQFSIRWLLAVTTGVSAAFSIVGLALRGYTWAGGVSIGLLALVLLAAVFAGMFAVIWAFAGLVALFQPEDARRGRSPFGRRPPAPGPRDGPFEEPITPIILD